MWRWAILRILERLIAISRQAVLVYGRFFSLCCCQEVVDTCSSAFDETPSASLKDDSDGCVLLCNLSESEVEEASPVDCDEQCRRAADRRAPVEESQLRQVACSTEPKCSLDASPQLHSDSVSPQNFVSSTASARCSDRAKRSSPSHSLSVTSRKKLKRH